MTVHARTRRDADASTASSPATRLAIVVTHPIQYYTPFYRVLAAQTPLNVHAIFGARLGLDKKIDPELGIELTWKTDLLGGYDHEFLPGAAKARGTGIANVGFKGVDAALSAYSPDVVLLHGLADLLALRSLFWCTRRSVPAMMISDSSLHLGTTRSQVIVKRIVLPRLLGCFSALLSVGDRNKEWLQTFGVPDERIFRVPNMVDEGFWSFRNQPAEDRARERAALGLADDEFAVLFVGKLIERKRPGDILAALRRLRDMAPTSRRVRALFVGSGALKEALEAAARLDGLPADFLGFINIDRLPRIYAAADALVHPAEIETFGMIVLEAAILGLPLVLSERVGAVGPTSIARPDDNALIHPCGDVEALTKALHRLAGDPVTAARLRAASLRISEDLDWRAAVSGTVAAVEHCLRRRAA